MRLAKSARRVLTSVEEASAYRGYSSAIRLVAALPMADLPLRARIVHCIYESGHAHWLRLCRLDLSDFAKAFDLSRRCAWLVVLAFLSLSASGEQFKTRPVDYALYATVLASRAADFYTTERVLSHGGRELILPAGMVQNKPLFAIFSAGFGIADIYSSRLVAIHHPKLARTILAVHIATGAAAVGHNIANF